MAKADVIRLPGVLSLSGLRRTIDELFERSNDIEMSRALFRRNQLAGDVVMLDACDGHDPKGTATAMLVQTGDYFVRVPLTKSGALDLARALIEEASKP